MPADDKAGRDDDVLVRAATLADIAAIRAAWATTAGEGGGPDERMERYLAGEHHPQHALAPRVMFVALEGGVVSGYVAGHLTRRFGCEGELQWIYVAPHRRRAGIATLLVRRLAAWFAERNAASVCVDVLPENTGARRLYARLGAREMNPHWMVWDDISIALG